MENEYDLPPLVPLFEQMTWAALDKQTSRDFRL